MALSIKNIKEHDFDKICELYKIAFKKEPDKSLLKWKYFDSPYGRANFLGAIEDERLIGFCAILPEYFLYKGKKVKFFKYTDIMVDPNFRGKGIGREIICSLKKIAVENNVQHISYGIGSPIVTKIFQKNNYSFVSKVFNFFKPTFLLKFNSRNRLVSQLIKDKIVESFDSIPDLFKNYKFEVNYSSIEIQRTKSFLEWKMTNPRYDYKIFVFQDEGNIKGYLLLSISKYKVSNIIDLQYLNSPKIAKSLVIMASHYTRVNKLKGITAMTTLHSKFASVLKKCGFFVNPFEKGILKSTLDFNVSNHDELVEAIEERNWNLMGINYDDV